MSSKQILIFFSIIFIIASLNLLAPVSLAEQATEPSNAQTGRLDFCSSFTAEMLSKLQQCNINQDALRTLTRACSKDSDFLQKLKTKEGEKELNDALNEYSKVMPCIMLLSSPGRQ